MQTETGALANQLRDYILGCETEGFRKKQSPQIQPLGLFESEFDFLSWPDQRVQEFKAMMSGYLGAFVKSINGLNDQDLETLKFDNHCWFHITRDGAFFQPHNHPNASFSAIYCVDPGDEEPPNPSAAGHIIFADPRNVHSYMDPANKSMRRELSYDGIRFRLAPAELIIFPSYLYHFVEPYIGEKPRITIAANFWFSTIN